MKFYKWDNEVITKKPFETFVVMRHGIDDRPKFHNFYTVGSLDRNGSLNSSTLEEFIYVNLRLTNSQAEENHVVHYIFKFADEFAYVAHYAKELEFDLQRAPIIDEKDLVSIQFITDDIHFGPPPKRKKMSVL